MQMSMIPNTIGPIPFGHLAQAMDPIYRETDPFELSPWMAKIPGLSSTLDPQYTPTGELRKRHGTPFGRMVNPILMGKERKDPIANAARMLDEIGSPPTPPQRYTYVKGVKVYYTPEERRMLARAQEAATRMIGTRLLRDPGFNRLPDNEDVATLGAKTKKQVVKKVYSQYRRKAKQQLQGRLMQRALKHQGGEALAPE
jgi:hypothetical protein